MQQITDKQFKLILAIFAVIPFLWGLYYGFAANAVAIVLLVFLVYIWAKNKNITIPIGIPFLILYALLLLMFLSIAWAVDRGMAFIGSLKFLSVIPFVLVMALLTDNQKDKLFEIIPYSAGVMTVVCMIAYFTPLKEHFFMAERLGGFFQYSNTCALFFLVALVICTAKEMDLKKWVISAVLLVGIIITGSRSVFIFLLVYIIYFLVKNRKNKYAKIMGLSFVLLIIVSAILVLATGNSQLFGRFWTASLKNSTFVGRLLYYSDAVKMMMKHPFGLGVNGYQYVQYYEQTGVYSVKYVHNDFLQLGLDCGFVALILAIVAFVWVLRDKKIDITRKIIFAVVCVHSLFDFNLQYIAIVYILIMCMDFGKVKELKITKSGSVITNTFVTIFVLLFVWQAVATFLAYSYNYRLATDIMPFFTDAVAEEMKVAKGQTKIKLANEVLALNKYVAEANKVLADAAFDNDDYISFIQIENKVLDGYKYTIEEYENYLMGLSFMMQSCIDSGNEDGVKQCANEIINVPNRIDKVKSETSSLAWQIKDKPQLELSEEYKNYIEKIKIVLEDMQ